ncbi:MAG: hypothetical protein GF387_02765 [Candidatus Portnoybacteria bacterium]|nr:hypothetical protein [Candidatus Portnoybacteria bacterium]
MARKVLAKRLKIRDNEKRKIKEKIMNFEKPKFEKKEKVLNQEEIEYLGEDMKKYVTALKERIEEIEKELESKTNEKLKVELEELRIEYEELKDFTEAIEEGDFEEITEKDKE